MFAPGDEDDPERVWPRRPSRRREWRNRGLRAAAWAAAVLVIARLGWAVLSKLAG